MTYKTKNKTQKQRPPICDKSMSFEECELSILRQAVDTTEEQQNQKVAQSPEVNEIIKIVEEFLKKKKCICYGGTAINNILPKFAQFYNRNVDVPDYDFFSRNALEDAKELADIYFKKGYGEVEAKAGMHAGTFKVFVNFIPVADITALHPTLYTALEKEAVVIAGIHYAPPNYLRMGMYLELSRPQGDVSRWEKVLKRIILLNRFFPLVSSKPCEQIDFQRGIDFKANDQSEENLYYLTRDALVDQGAVFFGGYGASLYSRYMSSQDRRKVQAIPDFDVLTEDPALFATIVKERLERAGYQDVELIKHTAIGEVIPAHVQIVVNGDTIALLYQPISCHSYNAIQIGGKEIRVATIDTMLSLYLAFLYGDKPYFHKDRILCMAMYLFNVQQRNRLEQRGLLKRFSLTCYGKQETKEDIRAHKTRMFEELKGKKNTPEYDYWFLKYNPVTDSKLKIKRPVKNEKEKSRSKTQSRKAFTHTARLSPRSRDEEEERRQSASFSSSPTPTPTPTPSPSLSPSYKIPKKTKKQRKTRKSDWPYKKRKFFFWKK